MQIHVITYTNYYNTNQARPSKNEILYLWLAPTQTYDILLDEDDP